MSENRHTPQSGGLSEDAAQIHEHLSHMTSDEIVDEMTDKWFAMDENTYNPQLIDAYIEAIDKKESVATDFDASASLAAFREKHKHLFTQIEPANTRSDTPQIFRIRKSHRILRFVAAIVIVMLGCMITAQALGLDVFGMIARWSDEVFHFSTSHKEAEQISSPVEASYSSLYDALKAYGITDLIVPTWYPSGFHLVNVKVTPTPTSVRFQAAYIYGDKFLTVTIWQMASVEDADSRVFEKDNQDVISYDHNNVEHYIMSNNNQVTAAWTNNKLMGTFSGDISENEAKQMIDSIYERGF